MGEWAGFLTAGPAARTLPSPTGAPVPLYYRLREAFLARLAAGELPPGSPFPTERELIAQYGVSRTTVREALQGLVREGLLVRRQGKGTFVAARPLEEQLGALTGFSEEMQARGLRPGARVLSIETVHLAAPEAALLGQPVGAPAYRIVRLRLADGQPMELETNLFPQELGRRLAQENLEDTGYYRLLEERFGLHLAEAEQTIEARAATVQEAEALGLPRGAPVLVLRRLTRDVGGRPVELSQGVYRADRYRYRVRLRRLARVPVGGLRPAAGPEGGARQP